MPARDSLRSFREPKNTCWAVCVFAILAVAISVAAQKEEGFGAPSAPAGANHAIARKLTLNGVPDFGEVTPKLYRGGQPTKEGFRNLAKMGIKIVVDLRGSRHSERQVVTELGMKYVSFPWRCYRPRDEPLAEFLMLIRENPGKKIFVHCRVGDDRTGMDIAAYRMAEQGWTPEEAKKEMEAYGVNWFHRTICPGLSSYEEKFPERFKTSPTFEKLRGSNQTSDSPP
jgi:tyrosine-protein phosphatase SIW14